MEFHRYFPADFNNVKLMESNIFTIGVLAVGRCFMDTRELGLVPVSIRWTVLYHMIFVLADNKLVTVSGQRCSVSFL